MLDIGVVSRAQEEFGHATLLYSGQLGTALFLQLKTGVSEGQNFGKVRQHTMCISIGYRGRMDASQTVRLVMGESRQNAEILGHVPRKKRQIYAVKSFQARGDHRFVM